MDGLAFRMNKSGVRVYIRLRPVIHEEGQQPEEACLRAVDHNRVELINWRDTRETLEYTFKQVFAEDSTQEELFCTCVQPLLSRFVEQRQNITVFTYGPTGAGKTFTILGTNECPGIIPRTIRRLFQRVRQMSSDEEQFSLSMSYLEIYQEKVFDLLDTKNKDLVIRQDQAGNIFVPGITQEKIKNFETFEKLFVPASANRRVGMTKLNVRSSRSHSILQIQMKCVKKSAPNKTQHAKLYLIDLAGSEDNRRTGNTGVRLKESGSINSSLHVLGKVVDALNAGTTARIPYRDSKLTRLLQDSLGGSAHTCMIVNVSPEMQCLLDTQTTINFATKSKNIINRPFTREIIKPDAEVKTEEDETSEVVSTPVKTKENTKSLSPPLPFLSPLISKHVNKLESKLLDRLEGLERLMMQTQHEAKSESTEMHVPDTHEDKFEQHDMKLAEIRKTSTQFKLLRSEQASLKERELKRRRVLDMNMQNCEDFSPLLIKKKRISTASRKNLLGVKEPTRNESYFTTQRPMMLTVEKSGSSSGGGDIITIKVRSETQELHASKVLQILNTGTEKELKKLRGIGAVRASQIYKHRMESGGFENIEDLKRILPEQFVRNFLEKTLLHNCNVQVQ